MSFAPALVLAVVATQTAPAAREEVHGEGAQVVSAEVSARIVRPAVVQDGKLTSGNSPDAPRSQVRKSGARVTFEFE